MWFRTHWRYTVMFTASIAAIMLNGQRSNLSVAIVAMTQNNYAVGYGNISLVQAKSFNWSMSDQALVLGAYFYAYVPMQIPVGYLINKYSPQNILLFSVFFSSVLTLSSPFFADLGPTIFAIIRVFIGLFSVPIFPTITTLIKHWAPSNENTACSTIYFICLTFGGIVAQPLSGLVSSNGKSSWKNIFYLWGCLGLIWVPLWSYLGSDSPEICSKISKKEKEYILRTRVVPMQFKNSPFMILKLTMNWRIYAAAIAYISHSFNYFLNLICIPTYLSLILKYSLKKNGLMSSTPLFVMLVFIIVIGPLTDLLIKRFPRCFVRSFIFSSAAFAASSCFLFIVYFGGNNSSLVMVCIAINMGFCGTLPTQILPTIMEQFPKTFSLACGLINGLNNCAGFLAPFCVSFFTSDDVYNRHNWNMVFLSCVAIYGLGVLCFNMLIFIPQKSSKDIEVSI